MTTKILETQNEAWGFWGTAYSITENDKETKKIWDEAFKAIQKKGEFTPEQTRDLMDSRWGRHTVDYYYDEIKAGTFTKAFNKKAKKEELKKEYRYFVA